MLRQGIIWSGGTAWTGAHHQWLNTQQFSQLGLQMAYDTTLEAPADAQPAAVLTEVKGNSALDLGCAPRHPRLSGSPAKNAHQERPTASRGVQQTRP